jgi:hypothetical protein
MSGEDDHLSLGAYLADLTEDFDAGQSGHAKVKQGRVVKSLFECAKRGCAVGTNGDFMAEARQLHLHEIPQVGFIVGEKDPESSLTRLFHRSSFGKLERPGGLGPETSGTF